MANTASGAENKIIFISEAHEKFYFEKLTEVRYQDEYHKALIYSCADSILIPVQAAYLPVKGLQQLIKTIGKVKRQINPKLEIEGILLTMVDNRTNYAKDIDAIIRESYGSKVKIFANNIPNSVRAVEISAEGVSIFVHDPKGKAASAYLSLTEEVLANV